MISVESRIWKCIEIQEIIHIEVSDESGEAERIEMDWPIAKSIKDIVPNTLPC